MIDAVLGALTKGTVLLWWIGPFAVSVRAARIGRNPSTGKEVKIAAKKVAKFSPVMAQFFTDIMGKWLPCLQSFSREDTRFLSE
jgi:hypothetical protein